MTVLTAVGSRGTPPVSVEVPPFPAVAIKALQLVSNEDPRLRDLHNLIRTDPVLSTEIIRLVNSPLYATRVEIRSTLQAMTMLGCERLKALILTVGIRKSFGESLSTGGMRACWRHSLASALIAEELAPGSSIDKDAAHTAGLMHDIGRLALIVTHPKRYPDFLKSTECEPCDVVARERELFGVDHCQAGEALVKAWNLPDHFLEITAHHHETHTDRKFDLLAAVHFSCRLSDTLGFAAAHSIDERSFHELVDELPAHKRVCLPLEAEELQLRITSKVDAIDSA
jgi:putative nucleotidyltransferase with HDIG domain